MIGSGGKRISYFLAYLTANDDPSFLIDFLNLRRMIKYNPGVPKITIVIAISVVNIFTKKDLDKIYALANLFKNNPWYRVKKILIKDNIGRDFSSADMCLKEIEIETVQDDYVMIRNRSGYGPFSQGWYLSYISQYEKLLSGGLVGSTINFNGHPERISTWINTHVQTYVYLSQWKYFSSLIGRYPGSTSDNRFDVIHDGEIGLSRYFLKNKLQLSCLNWKDNIFDIKNSNNHDLPQNDIKKEKLDIPIRYKFKKYFNTIYDTFPYIFFIIVTKIGYKHPYSINNNLIRYINIFPVGYKESGYKG